MDYIGAKFYHDSLTGSEDIEGTESPHPSCNLPKKNAQPEKG